MNKLISIAGLAAVAIAFSLSAATPSSADDAGAAIAGGMLGFMAGAVVAGSGPHYVHHDDYDEGSYSWRRHVRACFRAYGDDYDPSSDTYLGDDEYDHRCRL